MELIYKVFFITIDNVKKGYLYLSQIIKERFI